ncbi:hypothetical protein N573_004015 [Limosilactobacillus fermentum 3872]|uniref:Uncharacterized protein n=1 Tax=Limosilactobacillus fermentum 3872 TaxID=1381124 RepID=A0A806TD79_LIMFE|nr:hypothetical protein N573_004015 [Limosilactobacillus fermentum 3872]
MQQKKQLIQLRIPLLTLNTLMAHILHMIRQTYFIVRPILAMELGLLSMAQMKAATTMDSILLP